MRGVQVRDTCLPDFRTDPPSPVLHGLGCLAGGGVVAPGLFTEHRFGCRGDGPNQGARGGLRTTGYSRNPLRAPVFRFECR